MIKKIILVEPRGFCAGVERAVHTVEEALKIFGAPVYVKHEIVHNQTVVADLEKKGAITVEELKNVPENMPVVFSAHGSKPKQYEEAKKRGLKVIDATCPLVTKVHLEVHRYIKEGYNIVYIGHEGHVEGEGVRAEAKRFGRSIPLVRTTRDVEKLRIQLEKIAYLTQTTLSLEETQDVIVALKRKYPHITSPPIQDICYATTNRQKAVKALSKKVDLVFVVGSKNSSNSNRLVETARMEGTHAELIDGIEDIRDAWLENKKVIGLTAGASAPEHVVRSVVAFFKQKGAQTESFRVVEENMHFSEPIELSKFSKTKI